MGSELRWTDLHAILELRYERIFGYEGKEFTLHGVRERHDQGAEDGHFQH